MRELYMTTDNFGLTPHNLTMREQIEIAHQLNFDGLEHHFTYDDELDALLKEFKLKVIDAKGRHIAEDGTVARAEKMWEMGVRYVEHSALLYDHESALRAAEKLDKLAKEVKSRYGFKVFIHNLAQEFLFDQGEYLIETVLNNTDPDNFCIELDLGWIICAGADPVPFLKKHPGRIELMHVKPCTIILGPKANGVRNTEFRPAIKPDPNAPKQDMSKFLNTLKAMQGPLSQAVRDYREPMEVAEELGCKAFILEREQSYLESRVDAMKEDIEELRKFW